MGRLFVGGGGICPFWETLSPKKKWFLQWRPSAVYLYNSINSEVAAEETKNQNYDIFEVCKFVKNFPTWSLPLSAQTKRLQPPKNAGSLLSVKNIISVIWLL